MLQETLSAPSDQPGQRLRDRVPLAVLCLSLCALLLVPLTIIGTGYLPFDDVLTNVAKAVGDTSWDSVVLLRPNVSLDLHNPGWDVLLRATCRVSGVNQNALVAIAVAGMMLAFLVSGLAAVRRPEVWLISLIVGFVAAPDFLIRITLGRPFVFSGAVLVLLLGLWSDRSSRVRRSIRCTVSILALSLATWIHGSWYLFILPIGAFFLTGRVRDGAALGACWIGGVLLGGVYTGHPIAFFVHHLQHSWLVFGALPRSLLVGELQAHQAPLALMTVVVAGVVWLGWRNRTWRVFRDPVFALMVVGWLLGFQVARFWVDWSMPAFLVWFARILDQEFQKSAATSMPRIVVALALGVALVMIGKSDTNHRWSGNILPLSEVEPIDSGWKEGLPQGDGIVYSASTRTFDILFYRYPRERWRYVLGSEAALMPPEDLPVFIRIQQEGYSSATIRPWMDKMRPNDRLVIFVSGQPAIPEFIWTYIGNGLWSGRLPAKPGSSAPE